MQVDFGFDTRRSRVVALDVELATPLGVVRQLIPAAVAGIEGARGSGRLGIDSTIFPAGTCELTLALVTADGRHGPSVSAAFDVAGGGGKGPILRALRPLSKRMTQPKNDEDTVIARVAIEAEAGDGEPVAAWANMRTPAGSETLATAELPDQARDEPFEVSLAALRARDELGKYAVGVALVDASGNVSEFRETTIELVSDRGTVGPSIDSFSPRIARAGDEVVVHGRGLGPGELEVTVGGIPAPVVSAKGKEIRIRMPDVAVPGRIAVVSAAGTGLSADGLSPRAQVRVIPTRVAAPEGVPITFTALVTGSTDGQVKWHAKAREGKPGTISSEGVYTPPLRGVKGAVTISAVSSADETASGRAQVRIIPHPSARGPLPLGPLGGTVRSEDDRAILELPEGALQELTTIGLETTSVDRENAAQGQIVVAAARISGGGQLSVPCELTLPLNLPLEEGAKVGIQVRDDPGDPWGDLPEFGAVIPGSEAMKIRLNSLHPHIRGTIDFDPQPPSYLPSIQSIGPSALHEGETAAVLVTGKNFMPGGTSVTVLKSTGDVEPRVDVRQVYVTGDGTKLGVTLKAGVMTDLAEGDRRYLTLRVTTPAGAVMGTISILGHDELDIGGATATVSQSGTFSRVRVGVGGTLRLARTQPPVSIITYETIVVGGDPGPGRGLVHVTTGAGGPAALGDAGGAGGAGGATGLIGPVSGRGGTGGSGGLGASGAGASGGAGSASAGPFSGGIGQLPGAGGGGGLGSRVLFGSGSDGARGTGAPMPGFPSALFLPAPPLVLGAGGGGGGGGGGEGLVFKTTGGGGGGGGAGGGALELAAGEEIRVRGRVAANGGDGGDGAFPFAVGTPPSAPPLHAGCGGGGGGGSGGTIFLRGLRLLEGEVLAVGGMDGRDARFADVVITTPGTLTELQRLLANPQSGLMMIEGSVTSAATVAPGAFLFSPDLDYRPNLVTGNPQITVSGFGRGGNGAVRVRNSAGQQLIPVSGQPFSAQVTLAPGFNDLDGVVYFENIPGDPPIILSGSHPVRVRRILYLPGAATFATFAGTLIPATATVATERTVNLLAAVTGGASALAHLPSWSIDGGVANGVVDQLGNYRAPCAAPPGPVTVRASSPSNPAMSSAVTVTVIQGITVTAQAPVGTPADPAAPSANVGQTITITIPTAVKTLTGEDFGPGQNVHFMTVERDASGMCQQGVTAVAGAVAVGMTSLQVAVPSCAAPNERLRVSGHGCSRLQVVPTISTLHRTGAHGPGMAITGSGFACGATEVIFGATPVPAAQVLSVTCDVILLGTRPAQGEPVVVRTAGGTSNAVT
jgi:hypothetical protein